MGRKESNQTNKINTIMTKYFILHKGGEVSTQCRDQAFDCVQLVQIDPDQPVLRSRLILVHVIVRQYE